MHLRYGSICIPASIGMEEMQRECAFFGLPDDVKISQKANHEVFPLACDLITKCTSSVAEQGQIAAAEAVAACLFLQALKSKHWDGPASVTMANIDPSTCITSVSPEMIKAAAKRMGAQHGLSCEIQRTHTLCMLCHPSPWNGPSSCQCKTMQPYYKYTCVVRTICGS